MSLVNDALKRAKEAQDKQAAAPVRGAPLHTTPPPPASKMWMVALLCFVLAIGGAAAGLWYWKNYPHPQWLQTQPEAPAKPAYTIIIGANPDAKPKSNPPPAVVVVTPIVTTPSAPAALIVDKRPTLNLIPPQIVVTQPPPPPQIPPEALKLQGILYSATKPAAILNGRTVFVGDRIGEISITDISVDKVTITYSNHPIVLQLP